MPRFHHNVIDTTTHDGTNSPNFIPRQDITALGFRSDPIWRIAAGQTVSSNRYFCYGIDYIPIETRLATHQ